MKPSHVAGWILVLVLALALVRLMRPPAPGPGAGTGAAGPAAGGPPPAEAVGQRSLGIQVTPAAEGGVLIDSVLPAGAGERAGLKAGEVILEVGGQPVEDHEPIHAALAALRPSDTLTLKVRRLDGSVEDVVASWGAGEQSYELSFARSLISQGVTQLILEQRIEDGLWPHYQDPERPSVAVTALVAYALARAGEDLDAGQRKELAAVRGKLLAHRGKDGGLQDPAQLVPHRVYATGLLLMALGEEEPLPRDVMGPLSSWLAGAQVHEPQGFDPIDSRYGGWSYYDQYQTRMRTDLSTARFALQGLASARIPAGDPVWSRAGLFLDELQNHTLITSPGDALHRGELDLRDGGFSFTPRAGKAGDAPLGDTLLIGRSYGSASADGLIGLLATLGVDRREASPRAPPADPRLQAALRWLAGRYELDEVPGFVNDPTGWASGLHFYYLAGLAEGLHRAGVRSVRTEDEVVHLWPEEVIRKLGDMHGRRGRSFTSDSALMHEDTPTIAGAFAVIALAAARDRLLLGGGCRIEAGAAPAGPPRHAEEPRPQPADAQGRGLAVFRANNCASCHLDDATGNGPPLVGVGDLYLATHRTEARARAALQSFLREPRREAAIRPGEALAQMPALTPELVDDATLEDLITFLLSRGADRPVSDLR